MPPEASQIAAKKNALRIEMKRALRDIPESLRLRDEAAVLDKLSDFLLAEQQRHRALRVALYASRVDEFSTRALDHWLAERGIARAVPLIERESLRFVEVTAQERIHDFPKDRFGIPTPPSTRSEIDLMDCQGVVVPGLAFDSSGGRMGYGRGFYDRCLAKTRQRRPQIWRLAMHFDVQLVQKIPMSPWDERIDWLCSSTRGLQKCR